MKGKEIFRLYAVKHDTLKEYFADAMTAGKIAQKYNANISIVQFMKRPDNSVYSVTTSLTGN